MAHFGWMWRSIFAGIDLENYPYVKRWFDQIASRSAVKVAISKLEVLVLPAV